MIYLTKISVLANAPRGATIGVITVYDSLHRVVPCNLQLTSSSRGFFNITGAGNLSTAWDRPVQSGFYPITIQANGVGSNFSEMAEFVVQVTGFQ